MDGLTLLSEGRAAGLTVIADGDRLVIRGPKSADAVARRLLAHKAVILALLAAGNGNTNPLNPERIESCVDGGPCPWDEATEPGPACPVCGSLEKWWDILGGEHCQVCEREKLDRALRWAEKAARLREQAQPRKRIAPGCVAAGSISKTSTEEKSKPGS